MQYIGTPPPAHAHVATAAMDHHASVRAVLRALPAARHAADAVAVLAAEDTATVALHRVGALRLSHRVDRWQLWRPVAGADDGDDAPASTPARTPPFVEHVVRGVTPIDWNACVAALVEGCALGLLDLTRVEDRALAIRILLRHACRPVQVVSASAD